MNLSEIISSLTTSSKGWLAPVRTTIGESKGVQILSGMLVLQLAVAAGLLWKSSSQADFEPDVQLVDVDPSTVDEIIIDDGKERLTLTSADDQWRLSDEHKTLADTDKISQLLSDFTQLKPGLPVASTAGSHQQLEVADDAFQRRVTLKTNGETVADLYMGTSPGFRKSHIRRVDQDQVYAARMNTFDVPSAQNDWLDRNLLALDSITGVQSEVTELALVGEQWTIVNPKDQSDTHEIDQAGMDSLVSRLSSLRVNGFASPLEPDEPSDAASGSDGSDVPEAPQLLTHSIKIVQNDTPVTLVLSRQGSNATVKRSDVAGLFSLPIGTYEALTAEVINQLIVEKSAEGVVDKTVEDKDKPQG